MAFDISSLARSKYLLVGISTISNMLVRAGIFLVVAPILGPKDQGTLVVVSAWSALFCIIVQYGFNVRALKVIPTNLNDAYAIIFGDLKTMLPLAVATALTAQAAIFFILPYNDWLVFWIVLVATMGSRVIDYGAAVLRALDKFLTETKLALISCISQFSLVVGAGLIFRSLFAVAIALLISRLGIMCLSLFTISSQQEVSNAPNKQANSVSNTLKSSFAYSADSAVAIFLQQIDVVVLNALATRETVGIYGAGSRLIQLLLALPWVVTNIAVPAVGRAKTSEERKRQLTRLKYLMTGAALAGALGLLVFGPLFTNYFLGSAFSALNLLWPIFAVLVLARFLEAYMAILMLIDDQVAHRAFMQAIALGTISLGGWLLIPQFGASGLIATVGVSALFSATYYAYRLTNDVIPPRRSVIILAIATAIGLILLM